MKSKKPIIIICTVGIVILFTFIMAQLQDRGIVGKAAANNTTKQETKKDDTESKITSDKVKIDDKVSQTGYLSYTINLGTGTSNKSLLNSMNVYIYDEMKNIKSRKDIDKITTVTFIFNGDTNQGNTKIASFDYDNKTIGSLDLNSIDKNNIADKSSHKWLSSAFNN